MDKLSPNQAGFWGTVSLLLFYFLTMTLLSRSIDTAWEQFKNLWWGMIPLSVGFGIQFGLYTKLRMVVREKAKKIIAGSGITSGAAMVACCAHHLADVLPLIGLSALSVFLSHYQILILVGSLVINLIGIRVMLNHLKMLNYVAKS